MPFADVGGVKLFYEETGAGAPLVFVHEFAGDHQSWHLQVRFFSRRYRTIAYNARGYPPSDVPEEPGAYSQDRAADDILGLLDHLKIPKAHVCGLSMGGMVGQWLAAHAPAQHRIELVQHDGRKAGKDDQFEDLQRRALVQTRSLKPI